jgi:hypothetical protein
MVAHRSESPTGSQQLFNQPGPKSARQSGIAIAIGLFAVAALSAAIAACVEEEPVAPVATAMDGDHTPR